MAKVEVNSGMLKAGGMDDYNQSCRALVERLVAEAGLPSQAPWSVFVTGCHKYRHTGAPASPSVWVGQTDRATRRLHLKVRPVRSTYHYELALSTPRDVDFDTGVQRVREAAARISSPRLIPEACVPVSAVAVGADASLAEPTTPAPAAPVPPAVEAIRKAAARVTAMQSGLASFLNFAAEAEAAASLRAEVEARVQRVRAAAAPLAAKESALAAALAEAEAKANEAAATFKSLRARLAEAESEFKSAEGREGRCKEAWQAACAAAQPVVAELREAEAALAECDRMDAERAKAVAGLEGMTSLLAALEKMGGENRGSVAA